MTGAPPAALPAPEAPAPGLLRRLACLVYEGMLLFGVVMIAGYLYSSLTQQRHALHGQFGLQAFLFVVLGVYFVFFWSRGGQTVAMKAWHVRVVAGDGATLRQWQAFRRYLLSWVWWLPALGFSSLAGLQGLGVAVALLVGVIGYALLSRLHPQGQFWHDAVAGTRLIDSRPAAAEAP